MPISRLSCITLFSFQGAILRSLRPEFNIHSYEHWIHFLKKVFFFWRGARRSVVFLYTQAEATKSKGKLVGLNGLEPSTSRLSGGRSNLLSYKPIFLATPLLCTWLSFYPAGLLLQTCCGCLPLRYYLSYKRLSYGASVWLVSFSRDGSPSLPFTCRGTNFCHPLT